MKTIILYATKTGFVTECVEKLANKLSGNVDSINLAGKIPVIDFSKYDRVVIGGSIHADKIQKSVKKLCARYAPDLRSKKLGLFISCLTPPQKADKYFGENFPYEIVSHAAARGVFGAAVYYERLNPLERFILKKITKKEENFSQVYEENISAFARAMA